MSVRYSFSLLVFTFHSLFPPSFLSPFLLWPSYCYDAFTFFFASLPCISLFPLSSEGYVKVGNKGGDSYTASVVTVPSVCPETGGRMKVYHYWLLGFWDFLGLFGSFWFICAQFYECLLVQYGMSQYRVKVIIRIKFKSNEYYVKRKREYL